MIRPALTRVLIVSHDRVGRQMGGAGVRYWEMARVLSSCCHVTLAAPEGDLPASSDFTVIPYHPSLWGAGPADAEWVRSQVSEHEVVVLNGRLLTDHSWLAGEGCRLVVDLYGPSLLENLEMFLGASSERQWEALSQGLTVLGDQLRAGDFFLCSSERQRDFWLGLLMMAGRVNPLTYSQDRELRRLVAVAPFGLPSRPPRSRGPVLKGVWPGIQPGDKVVLWGGGIWDWLDPLTLLRGLDHVRRRRDDVKLFFLGTTHPVPGTVPFSRMALEAIRLAKELGLLDRWAFFGHWVPYEDREAYLLESDVGVSLHLPTLESRFAYRTRVLDYVWAGLPLVLTDGDEWADLTRRHGLGRVVAPGDDRALAEALLETLQDESGAPARTARLRQLAEQMSWEKTLTPLVAYCAQPWVAADRRREAAVRPGPILAQSKANGQASLGGLRAGQEEGAMNESSAGSQMPTTSLVVVNWNGLGHLQRCLPSVLAEAGDEAEVVVVDNASTDGSADYVASAFPQARLVRNSLNRGFPGGGNDGWRAARGQVCVLLNNDISPRPGFVRALLDALAQAPEVAIAGAKLVYPDGQTIQHAGGVLLQPSQDGRHYGYGEVDRGQYDGLSDVDYVTGAVMAVKRSVLEELGGFDEGFRPLDFEDVDLCWRARQAGYRIVYTSAAVAIHDESATAQQGNRRRWRSYHRGRFRFALKHLPLETLLDEFFPAEKERLLNSTYYPEEEEAARSAYLDILMNLSEIAEKRGELSDEERERLGEALEDLRLTPRKREATMPRLGTERASGPSAAGAAAGTSLGTATERAHSTDWAGLRSRAVLRPCPFSSRVPLVGSAIAAFREAWNNMATRWYLAPILEQQTQFNQIVVDRLVERDTSLSDLWQSLSSIDRDTTALVRELAATRHRLAHLQMQIARLSGERQPTDYGGGSVENQAESVITDRPSR